MKLGENIWLEEVANWPSPIGCKRHTLEEMLQIDPHLYVAKWPSPICCKVTLNYMLQSDPHLYVTNWPSPICCKVTLTYRLQSDPHLYVAKWPSPIGWKRRGFEEVASRPAVHYSVLYLNKVWNLINQINQSINSDTRKRVEGKENNGSR